MPLPRPLRVAAFLQLDTEHGRGILRGIAQVFRQHPQATVLKFNLAGALDAAMLRRLELDGIIAKISTRREAVMLRRLQLPAVNISGRTLTPGITTVNTDDGVVGQLALRHLHVRGYRHFAYCSSRSHLAARRRWEGFAEAAARQGAASVHRFFVPHDEDSDLHPETLLAQLGAWIKGLPKPVGIFAFTDRLALRLDEICHRGGWRIPADVALLGVGNDLTRLEFAHVDVSSIQLNTQRIGALAAETLLQLVEKRGPVVRDALVSPLKIVTRRSTDHFAVDDEAVANALDYIREHVGNTVYVDDVARAVGVSRRLLEIRFRRAISSSIYAEVRRLHFDRAIELMADTDLTLAEIAYAAGFQSAQFFSAAFRQRFREAPSSYRERLLGKTS